jgi:NCS1 family nucleobase:cation symporter-1
MAFIEAPVHIVIQMDSVLSLISLGIAILPNIPGFLVDVKVVAATSVSHFPVALYDYAWFVGFAIAFVVYLLLRKSLANK